MRFIHATIPIAICAAAALGAPGDAPGAGVEFFESRIRPLLAERCYECHGPNKQKSNLRLDHISTILTGGERGPALAPGNVASSRLIEAVGYENVDLQMPPKRKLSEREIADLTKWVAMGAPWPEEPAPPGNGNAVDPGAKFDLAQRKADHWAWQPIRGVAPPAVKQRGWPHDPIDRFILARLEANGMTPAPAADRRTWIRRVYFDIIGLPPTPEAVNAFLADDSDEAYERIVDDLLASPRFGERWGRHWLDLVRYAETHGHEFDYPIENAWRYRDYVIRALNTDVRYDQFVREHIAGDLLEKPRINPADGLNESILATGFWFMPEGLHAPVDVRQDQADRIDNMIDVFGKTFLGLTVACARCHDHKFDAISTADYYALSGLMQGMRRQQAFVDAGGHIAAIATKMRQRTEAAGQAIVDVLPAAAKNGQRFAAYLIAAREVGAANDERRVAEIVESRGLDAAELARWLEALADPALEQPDHALHAWHIEGSTAASEKAAVDVPKRKLPIVTSDSKDIRALLPQSRLLWSFDDGHREFRGWYFSGEAFRHGPTRGGQWSLANGEPRLLEPHVAHSGAMSHKLQGTLRSATFTLDGDHLLYRVKGRDAQLRLIIDGYMMATFSQLLFEGTSVHVETSDRWVWYSVDVGRYRGHRAHIELIDEGDGYIAMEQVRMMGTTSAALDEQPPPRDSAAAASIWREMLEALRTKAPDLSSTHVQLVNWALEHGLLGMDDAKRQAAPFRERLVELERALPQPLRVLAADDGSGIDEQIFIRGSHRSLGEIVPRRFLTALSGDAQPPLPEDASGRLELAERVLTDGRDLVSRVIVNRVWAHLFGGGLVATVDNFGVLGEPPTHPELLDHLADSFVKEDGWSLKALIRRLVLSETYRMSSGPNAAAEQVDAQNLLLHRMNIKRLEGEAIRDSVLAISGRLDLAMGGPSVPVHLTPFMEGRGRPGSSGPLDGDGRRSIYLEVRRNFLNPMMLAFDTPAPFSTVGRRSVSNVPAQALIMMNDPLIAQQASVWAKRSLADTSLTPPQRIELLYQQALARPATEDEIAAALTFLRRQAETYGLDAARIESDERLWTDLCHVLMNVKEFIFIP